MPKLTDVIGRYSAYVFEVEWYPSDSPDALNCKVLVIASSFDEAAAMVTPNLNDVRTITRVNHCIERIR
jgi:hypothetical protein